MQMGHICWLCVTAAVLTGDAPRIPEAQGPDPATAAIDRYLAHPRTAFQYSATRRLEASGRGHQAWLDVRTDFSVASGLQYEVIAEGGSSVIRARVLRSLLAEEQRLVAGDPLRVAISHQNYRFTPDGFDEQGLPVVRLRPRRPERGLVDGHLVLTPDGDLLRLEGQLAKNPSFWVTRTNIVRSYQRINGVLMPVSLETTAQLRLLGSSRLHMTYRYTEIDDQPVKPGS